MAENNNFKPDHEGGEDEEEELDETAYKQAKDALLFVIEVSPSMLKEPPPREDKKADRDSPASAALKCAYALMQQRIISNPNDMMGIILYGTKQTKSYDEETKSSGMNYPYCYVLSNLNIPAAEDVKSLKALIEDPEEFEKLMVPTSKEVLMSNMFVLANQLFSNRAPNFVSRRLFIITDNDDPYPGEKQQRDMAVTRAKDLYDLGVVIELFPISSPTHDFDRSKLFNDLIYPSTPSDPSAPVPLSSPIKTTKPGDGLTLLSSLLSSINSRAPAKRALFSDLPLELGPGLTISVKGYIILKRQEIKPSCRIYLHSEKAQIVKLKSRMIADDTAREVEKTEIKKAYKFGGSHVVFTPEEISMLRNFGEPGIKIIGFKPWKMLPTWANTRPSTFIYPSEDGYVGSTRVFSALHQKMLKDKIMGLAWFIARRNAAPVITAVLPGAEKLNDDGEQTLPSGLWLCPLPFADDLRQDPPTAHAPAPDSLVDRMREIVQQLQLPKGRYDPSKYPNPALQWHYRILQAMALEEDLPEKPIDQTVPKYKQIHRRAGPYMVEWGNELERSFLEWQKEEGNNISTKLAKRPATLGGEPSSKRAKMTDGESGIGDDEMRDLFNKNTITKHTAAALKEWMQSKGIDTSGKKSDLVTRIETYFETK